MKQLHINGIIGRKGDSAIGADEEVFSLEDLENFILLNGEDLDVIINSGGGSVDEGLKIYNRLSQINANTTAITANSIASIIFLAGKERKVNANTEMIIHNAWVDAEAFAGEKLNVHTLNHLAGLFADTDQKLMDIYIKYAGKESEQSIFAYMAQETNLGATMALKLGFATEIIEGELTGSTLKNRVITYSQNYIDTIRMNQNEKIGTFEKLLNSLAKAFKLSYKNMVVSTTEGVELFIDGEGDQQYNGKIAYISEGGIPTEATAPQGAHILSDGTQITVGEGGVIVEAIEAMVEPTVEEVTAKYEEEKVAMEEEKKDLLNQIATLTSVNAENSKKVEDLQSAFVELKNQVAGDPDKKDIKTLVPAEDFAKMSPAQKARTLAMNKANNQILNR